MFAPAFSKALCKSYSQFVPGNVGMNTLGFAIVIDDFLASPWDIKFIVSIFSFISTDLVWNIGSSVSQWALYNSSNDISSFSIIILCSSVVDPSTI